MPNPFQNRTERVWGKSIPRTKTKQRTATAQILRRVRKNMWDFPDQFVTDRGLHQIQQQSFADLAGYLRKSFPEKPFRFLDCGAGTGQLGHDLRQLLGKQIHLTGIALNYPVRTKTQWKKMRKTALQWKPPWAPLDKKTPFSNLKDFRDWKKKMGNAKTNLEAYDEFFVGNAERFHPRQSFDIIFDLFGPTGYAHNYRAIVNFAQSHLASGGKFIVLPPAGLPKEVFEQFDPPERLGKFFIFTSKNKHPFLAPTSHKPSSLPTDHPQ